MASKKTAKKAGLKETGAKEAGMRKAATKRASQKVAAKKTAAKKTAAKNTAAKSTSKKSSRSASKAAGKRGEDNYTKPELREKIKKQVTAGDKGGRAGQWSARKAQLVAHEYEAEGGGYKHARNAAQESLKSWGDEKWHTADGKQAIQGNETHRYLPDEAWKELSPQEQKATDRKKVAASKRGKQFVANTEKAATARRHASHDN